MQGDGKITISEFRHSLVNEIGLCCGVCPNSLKKAYTRENLCDSYIESTFPTVANLYSST